MKAKDTITKLHGHWKFDVYKGDVVKNADGQILNELVKSWEQDNLITTTGKGLLLDRLFETAGFPLKISAMGVGASATAAAVTDTQLLTTPALFAFDSTPTRAGLVVTCVRTFATTEANINWQELALFNGTVNGTSIMFNRIAPIGPFNKTAALSILVTVTVTQG